MQSPMWTALWKPIPARRNENPMSLSGDGHKISGRVPAAHYQCGGLDASQLQAAVTMFIMKRIVPSSVKGLSGNERPSVCGIPWETGRSAS